MRLKGQGQPRLGGGPPGDAFIESHPFFTRKDMDVYVEVPVTPREAVLGGRIEVVYAQPDPLRQEILARLKREP